MLCKIVAPVNLITLIIGSEIACDTFLQASAGKSNYEKVLSCLAVQ